MIADLIIEHGLISILRSQQRYLPSAQILVHLFVFQIVNLEGATVVCDGMKETFTLNKMAQSIPIDFFCSFPVWAIVFYSKKWKLLF